MAAAVIRNAGSDIAVDAERVLGHAMPKVKVALQNRWQEAIDSAGSALPDFLRTPSFVQAEYEMAILPNCVTSRDDYFAVSRLGRGVPLDRAKRDAIWGVVEAYRLRGRAGGVVDFGEAATIAAAHLRRIALEEDHATVDRVLVDEGQDLTPARWQLLRALVPEQANDLFIAEDSHQRIYGQRVVLAHYGIRVVGRSQRLTLNYRTTEQNLEYAMTLLQGGDYADLEDGKEAPLNYRSARRGPRPKFVEATDPGDELDKVADLLRDWAHDTNPKEATAVLVRDRSQGDRVSAGLAERGVPIEVFDGGNARPAAPVVMTMHRAKGTEFSRVVMFGLGVDSSPVSFQEKLYDDEAWKDALLRERSLLYVAATRARDHLALSWSGRPNSFVSFYRTMATPVAVNEPARK